MTLFKIASYNVHCFNMKNRQSIVSLLDDEHIDVCGLQEVPGKQALANLLCHQNIYDFVYLGPYFTYGLGIIYNKTIFTQTTSKLHLLHNKPSKKAALEVTLVDRNGRHVTVFVTHLDHRTEPQRMSEVNALLKITALVKTPHVILGDFNALRRSDYTDDEWNTIARVRKESNWEAPRVDVTSTMEQSGYVDVLAMHNGRDIVPTSRFNTRVDYIYATKDITSISSAVVVSELNKSDHKPVVAVIKI